MLVSTVAGGGTGYPDQYAASEELMATVLDVAGHPDVLFQSERILRVSLSKRFCFTYEFS